MTRIASDRVRLVAASYGRAFGAAALACWLAGERDWRALLAAGVAAVAPPLLRWLNPNDGAFGRGASSAS